MYGISQHRVECRRGQIDFRAMRNGYYLEVESIPS